MVNNDDNTTRRSRWEPTGSAPVIPVALSEENREDIAYQLGMKPGVEFYGELARALSIYKARCEVFNHAPKPAEIRRNLQRALKAARNLNKALAGLDVHSRCLSGGDKPGRHINELEKRLSTASAQAQEYPKSGRLRHYPRFYLAVDVAETMRRYTGIEVAPTNGPFADLMEKLLVEILGEESSVSPDTLKFALAHERIEHEDGEIEYRIP